MEQRVAVVTGANRGIGFKVCRQLARRSGIRVVLTARDAAKGKTAVKKLADEGLEVDYHRLYVTEAKSIAALAAYLESRYGEVDSTYGTLTGYETGGQFQSASGLYGSSRGAPGEKVKQAYMGPLTKAEKTSGTGTRSLSTTGLYGSR